MDLVKDILEKHFDESITSVDKTSPTPRHVPQELNARFSNVSISLVKSVRKAVSKPGGASYSRKISRLEGSINKSKLEKKEEKKEKASSFDFNKLSEEFFFDKRPFSEFLDDISEMIDEEVEDEELEDEENEEKEKEEKEEEEEKKEEKEEEEEINEDEEVDDEEEIQYVVKETGDVLEDLLRPREKRRRIRWESADGKKLEGVEYFEEDDDEKEEDNGDKSEKLEETEKNDGDKENYGEDDSEMIAYMRWLNGDKIALSILQEPSTDVSRLSLDDTEEDSSGFNESDYPLQNIDVLLRENEEGQLLYFDEIKAHMKTRTFNDFDCTRNPRYGEKLRRKAAGLTFAPSQLLTHYTLTDLFERDSHGWAPIHYCAFRRFEACLHIILQEVPVMIEYKTKGDRLNATPILLATMSLHLPTIQLLISYHANLKAVDEQGHNIIQLCTYKQAIPIIKYFISLGHPALPVWNILVTTLSSNDGREAFSCAKTLRILTDICIPWTYSEYWKPLYLNNITQSISTVLRSDHADDVKEETLNLLLNLLSEPHVKKVHVEYHNIMEFLVTLISHKNNRISDLAILSMREVVDVQEYLNRCLSTNLMAVCLDNLAKKNDLELKNVLDLLEDLLEGNSSFQTVFQKIPQSFKKIVKIFNERSSKMITFSLLKICTFVTHNNPKNQDLFAKYQLSPHLARLSKARNMKLSIANLAAIRSFVHANSYTQNLIIQLGTPQNILSLLKKTRYLTIQELTASTLWEIGGRIIQNLWVIAESIGVRVLIEFVESHSSRLELIGAHALYILNKAPLGVHDAFFLCLGTQVLMRLLIRTTCPQTLFYTLKAIRYSCYKSSMIRHAGNQKAAAGDYTVQDCIKPLLDMYFNPPESGNKEFIFPIKGECVMTLGAIMLMNDYCFKAILKHSKFTYCLAINLLKSDNESIVCLAGQALAMMCYKNTYTQVEISSLGGVNYSHIMWWMKNAGKKKNRVHFAYLLVVLSMVFPDVKATTAAAEGIVEIDEFLDTPNSPNNVYEQEEVNSTVGNTCNYIAALCHFRAGIADAFLAIKTLEKIISLLTSPYEQTRAYASIVCGYFSFIPAGKRFLLRKFRQDTYLLDIVLFYCQDTRYNPIMLENWKYLEYVGLPPKDLSRGELIRERHSQILTEPRPHILTGTEDPFSGKIGAITYEVDDYEDTIYFTDSPINRKKNSEFLSKKLSDIPRKKKDEDLSCVDRVLKKRNLKAKNSRDMFDVLVNYEEKEDEEDEEEEEKEEDEEKEEEDEEDEEDNEDLAFADGDDDDDEE